MDENKSNIDFINNMDNWPNWPILPMKKRNDNGLLIGVIHCSSLTTVVEGLNIFGGWGKAEYDAAKKNTYGTVEELVADGWVVD